MNSAKSAQIPNFNYYESTTAVTTTGNIDFANVDTEYHNYWNVITITLIFFSIILLLIRKFRTTSHKSNLMLEVTDGNNCVLIHILKLQQCPSFWYLSKNVKPILDVKGCLISRLCIDWDSLEMVNKNGTSCKFPEQIYINPYKALKLRKIFQNKSFYAHSTIVHNNMVYTPKVQHSEWQEEDNVATDIAVDKIYPTLNM